MYLSIVTAKRLKLVATYTNKYEMIALFMSYVLLTISSNMF